MALGTRRFRQQVFRRLRIELWRNRPAYPRELLPWNEGSTQVDATIFWENPPTTVYIEVKYMSELARSTAGNNGQHHYPADQVIRNIRVGLLECGWFKGPGLFDLRPRHFVLLTLAPTIGHDLIEQYRDPKRLRQAIPFSERLASLPPAPFVGELSMGGLVTILRDARRWMTTPERKLADALETYLSFKLANVAKNLTDRPATEVRPLFS